MTKAVLSVRVDAEKLAKFDIVAARLRRSRADLVNDLIRNFLAPYEEAQAKLRADSETPTFSDRRRVRDVP